MVWEYLVLGAIVGWAVFYLWRTFFRKGGCACGSCPSAKSAACRPAARRNGAPWWMPQIKRAALHRRITAGLARRRPKKKPNEKPLKPFTPI